MTYNSTEFNPNLIMRVNKFIIASVAVISITGFTTAGAIDAIRTKDNLEFQKVQLKSKQLEMEELNKKYNNLDNKLEKANEEHTKNQSEIKKLEEEKKKLEEEKGSLQTQLQAKIEQKNKLAMASSAVINTITSTSTASASAVPSGNCVEWAKQAGITNPIAHDLIGRENKQCNPCIYNDGSPTGAVDCNYSGGRAYGIPQALPGNKMASAGADWRTNPVTQLKWMQSYVMGRYGSWEAAREHHNRMGWY